jgi:hypothetical protein
MLPFSSRSSRLLTFLFSILAALAPAHSQEIRMAEARTHFDGAVRDLARRSNLSPEVERRLREELKPGFLVPNGSMLDRHRAKDSIARSLGERRFGLESHAEGLLILPKPEKKYDFQMRQLLSGELVESICSDIRRRSIVAEINDGSSYQLDHGAELDHAALGWYLNNVLRVHDHQQVRDSFDSTHIVNVVTLHKDIQLLRLYGGESKPIGRYFFCCVWPNGESPGLQWSDATKLATPPGNLLKYLALVNIPAGTTVIVGTVADNFANEVGIPRSGGNAQIFIPEVKMNAFLAHELVEDTSHAHIQGPLRSEILIVSDDRVLRFRPKAEY